MAGSSDAPTPESSAAFLLSAAVAWAAAREMVGALLVFMDGAFVVLEGALAFLGSRRNAGEGFIRPKALIKANTSCRSNEPSRSSPSSPFSTITRPNISEVSSNATQRIVYHQPF
jgi:hypothetical protein